MKKSKRKESIKKEKEEHVNAEDGKEEVGESEEENISSEESQCEILGIGDSAINHKKDKMKSNEG